MVCRLVTGTAAEFRMLACAGAANVAAVDGNAVAGKSASGSFVNVRRPVTGSVTRRIGGGVARTGSAFGVLVFGSGAFRSYASTRVPSFFVYPFTWTVFDDPLLLAPLDP